MGLPGAGAFLSSFLVGKTLVSMAFPEFQRAGSREKLLITGGAAKRPPEARLKGPEKLITTGRPTTREGSLGSLVVKNPPASSGEI